MGTSEHGVTFYDSYNPGDTGRYLSHPDPDTPRRAEQRFFQHVKDNPGEWWLCPRTEWAAPEGYWYSRYLPPDLIRRIGADDSTGWFWRRAAANNEVWVRFYPNQERIQESWDAFKKQHDARRIRKEAGLPVSDEPNVFVYADSDGIVRRCP